MRMRDWSSDVGSSDLGGSRRSAPRDSRDARRDARSTARSGGARGGGFRVGEFHRIVDRSEFERHQIERVILVQLPRLAIAMLGQFVERALDIDRKSTRLNSSL